jgi:mono/diheme cytochrome c family protein
LETPVSQPPVQSWARRTVAIVILVLSVAIVAIVQSQWFQPLDPYVQTVLELSGDRERGQAIFSMNCAVCHGADGAGHVGPRLWEVASRKSRVAIIEQVTSGKTPPMPQFQPAPQDMADLLRYLETL